MSQGINAPYGLQPVLSQVGNGGTQKLGRYNINTAATTSIFAGDMVKYYPPGTANKWEDSLGSIVAGLTPQNKAAANVVVGLPVGIFVGCQYIDAKTGYQVNTNSWIAGTQVKAGTEIIAWVNDDPEVVFKVQISTSTNNTTAADQNNTAPSIFQNIFRGQNAQLQVGGAPFTAPANAVPTNNPATGNTTTGISAYYLDGSSINLTKANSGNSTSEIKIIGLAPEVQTMPNPSGLIPGSTMPFVDVFCKFNVHIHGSVGTPGVFFTS